jgi:orotidine-5'-phosphate decarboxylase
MAGPCLFPVCMSRWEYVVSFSERLVEKVSQKKTPLCLGIDPRWESLPKSIRTQFGDATLDPSVIAKAYLAFSIRVIDLLANLVPVIKPQSAFFEQLGFAGFAALEEVIAHAKSRDLLVILDAKRGDIASTAEAYASAAFGLDDQTIGLNTDALTINPYLGEDSITPFIASATKRERGLFVLVRTSNAGAGTFQDLESNGKPLYQHVAALVDRLNQESAKNSKWGLVGAVVGATRPSEISPLRKMMPKSWFLIPGVGAQGGKPSDLAPAFNSKGMGAIINSSRGLTFPFHPDDPNWESKIIEAAHKTISELAEVAKPGS